jgi:predicted RNA polymerase sigma factor
MSRRRRLRPTGRRGPAGAREPRGVPIDEGTELIRASLAGLALGPYQLQAAIAATHADAAGAYEHYRRAAKSTASIAEQRYLQSRASRVRPKKLARETS